MGIDLGDVRTGVALSDPSGRMAFGVCTLTEHVEEKLLARLVSLAKEKEAETVVFGLPVNMDGSKGERARKVEAFAGRFNELSGCPVAFADERLSTVLAHKILNETNTRGKKRKNVVDTLSAEIILQGYLDKTAN